MGASLTAQKFVCNVTDFVTGQKRKYTDSDDEESKIIEIAMHTPKKYVSREIESEFKIYKMGFVGRNL